MFKKEILPRFERFCQDNILQHPFDYLVPIETKGILVLNHVLERNPEHKDHVLYRRAFDFLPPETLSRTAVALIDDTVVAGRTLATTADALSRRGAGTVKKYSCMLCPEAETPRGYQPSEY